MSVVTNFPRCNKQSFRIPFRVTTNVNSRESHKEPFNSPPFSATFHFVLIFLFNVGGLIKWKDNGPQEKRMCCTAVATEKTVAAATARDHRNEAALRGWTPPPVPPLPQAPSNRRRQSCGLSTPSIVASERHSTVRQFSKQASAPARRTSLKQAKPKVKCYW